MAVATIVAELGLDAQTVAGALLHDTVGGPLPEGKAVKNRLHIDLAPSPDAGQEAEVRRLEDRGARRVGIGQDPEQVSWVVMADPRVRELYMRDRFTHLPRSARPVQMPPVQDALSNWERPVFVVAVNPVAMNLPPPPARLTHSPDHRQHPQL